MSVTRSTLLAALVASCAGFAAIQPAAADSSPAARADLTIQVGHDRDWDRRDYRDRRHYRHRSHYRKHRRCYTDVDYRYRWGHRVRIVERICFNRYGRRYVAHRSVVRIGHRDRYRHRW
jgi:hypothetical protein